MPVTSYLHADWEAKRLAAIEAKRQAERDSICKDAVMEPEKVPLKPVFKFKKAIIGENEQGKAISLAAVEDTEEAVSAASPTMEDVGEIDGEVLPQAKGILGNILGSVADAVIDVAADGARAAVDEIRKL